MCDRSGGLHSRRNSSLGQLHDFQPIQKPSQESSLLIHIYVIVLTSVLLNSSHVESLYYLLPATRTVPGDKNVSKAGAPDPVFPLNLGGA